jgi:hypothetical protein
MAGLVRAALSTTATRGSLGLRPGGRGQKLLPTVVAAKVERLSTAFGVESGCFVHGHSADGVLGHGFRFFHGHVSCLIAQRLHVDGHNPRASRTSARTQGRHCPKVSRVERPEKVPNHLPIRGARKLHDGHDIRRRSPWPPTRPAIGPVSLWRLCPGAGPRRSIYPVRLKS